MSDLNELMGMLKNWPLSDVQSNEDALRYDEQRLWATTKAPRKTTTAQQTRDIHGIQP